MASTSAFALKAGENMRSVLGFDWQLNPVDDRQCLAMAQAHGLPEILARILCGRGVALEHAVQFLNPTLREALPDPFHLRDMREAAERTAQAVMRKETVAVFGDYDVDGATSSALLLRFFRMLEVPALVHIPDRIAEGYGPNAPALLGLKAKGASLVITVDCGTVAFEPLKAASDAGLDVIVLDHHQGEARRPAAHAIVNPNRLDETSEHRNLAAVGVSFLFAVAVRKLLREAGYFTGAAPDLMGLLDLVALGTVCDVVPLAAANRALVTQGLKIMGQRRNLGLATLMDVARLDGPPTAYHAGFLLGPRINAGGRIGKSDLGVRLLATEDAEEALQLATELDRLNTERRGIETLALEEAMQAAERQANRPMLLVASERWHPGIIGIVAGRLKDKFHKPTAVVAFDGEIGKASLRSIPGVDIGALVTQARQAGLLLAGGGHSMAAGFTVARDAYERLGDFLCERVTEAMAGRDGIRRLRLDGMLHLSGATLEFCRALEKIGPCGAGNPQVRLAIHQVKIVKADIVGENHLRCIVADGAMGAAGGKLSCIAFRAAGTPLGEMLLTHRAPLSLAGSLSINRWQGTERVQMQIDDAASL